MPPQPPRSSTSTNTTVMLVATKAGPDAPLCRFYNTPRGCQFGGNCRNRHVVTMEPATGTTTDVSGASAPGSSATGTSLRAGGSNPGGGSKSILCRYYIAGNCTRGDSCWYLHDPSTLFGGASSSSGSVAAVPPAKSDASTSKTSSSSASAQASSKSANTTPHRSGRPSHSSAVPIAAPEPCVICFEDAPATYGLLEKCSHAFCIDCIRSWRNPSTKDSPVALSGVIKTCPACRVPSSFITPSKIFYPDSNPMKASTIKAYKLSMAKIPCRHFAKNPLNPFCPFGFDCFYSHIGLDGKEHVFDHGIEETAARAADRARYRAQRSRANDLRRVRQTLDSVGRMLDDDFGVGAFLAAMSAEFGELGEPEWDEEDEDEDEEEDDEDEWDTEEDGIAELDDDEEGEQWFAERVSMLLSQPVPPISDDALLQSPPRPPPMSPDRLPGFRRPRVGTEDSSSSLPYGDPSDEDASAATNRPASVGSSSSSNRPPIILGSFGPEDIPWNSEGRRYTPDSDGWWA